MRHKKKFNHLGRTAPHRKAMLANMASSLIIHKRITTTTAKAKALRSFVEPVITSSREDSTHSRRLAFRYLRDKHAVSELFREIAAKVGDRPGGYTRIIKLGNRTGDNADMCIIELVDYNENLLAEKAAARPKSTRRRRGGKKKADDAGIAVTATADEAMHESVEAPETETSEAEAAGPETETSEAETKETEQEADAAGPEKTAAPESKTPSAQTEDGAEDTAASEEETKEDDKEEKKKKGE